jgi:hypothetical protein
MGVIALASFVWIGLGVLVFALARPPILGWLLRLADEKSPPPR